MGGIIKLLIQGMLGGVAITLPTLIRRLMISVGIGLVVFSGFDVLLTHIKSMAFSHLASVGGIASQIIGLLNIDVAFSIVLSAYAIKLSFKMLGGTQWKQMRLL